MSPHEPEWMARASAAQRAALVVIILAALAAAAAAVTWLDDWLPFETQQMQGSAL